MKLSKITFNKALVLHANISNAVKNDLTQLEMLRQRINEEKQKESQQSFA